MHLVHTCHAVEFWVMHLSDGEAGCCYEFVCVDMVLLSKSECLLVGARSSSRFVLDMVRSCFGLDLAMI